jgi:hypothetical protein
LNEEFLLIKSEPEYIEILQILMEMLSSWDPEIQGLVVVWFIQWVMNYIETQSNMINWRSSLMYNDLQNAFDNILNKTIFDKYEINS